VIFGEKWNYHEDEQRRFALTIARSLVAVEAPE
jgi:hypothetical protein